MRTTKEFWQLAKTTKTRFVVALAWLRTQGGSLIAIVGARKLSQVKDNLACVDLTLSPEQLQRLKEVSQVELGFPHDFLSNNTIRDRNFGGKFEAIAR